MIIIISISILIHLNCIGEPKEYIVTPQHTFL